MGQTITIIELALLSIASVLIYTLIKTIFQDLTKYK